MTKALFYIIIISQIWLSIGSTLTHLASQDCDLVELIGEEEKEKEKEIEKEIEKIHDSSDYSKIEFDHTDESFAHLKYVDFLGRAHLQNTTPPPEHISFFC